MRNMKKSKMLCSDNFFFVKQSRIKTKQNNCKFISIMIFKIQCVKQINRKNDNLFYKKVDMHIIKSQINLV